MTAIAAIETDEGVWICSDAFIGGDDWADTLAKPKWTCSKGLVVATSGSMRVGQLVERVYLTGRRKVGESEEVYLMRAFADPARAACVEAEIPKADLEGFNALVVYQGKIYLIDSDFSVQRSSCRYNAIGAGSAHCMGSLFSTFGDPCKRLETAIESAAKHHPAVKGRFPAMFIPLKGPRLGP